MALPDNIAAIFLDESLMDFLSKCTELKRDDGFISDDIEKVASSNI